MQIEIEGEIYITENPGKTVEMAVKNQCGAGDARVHRNHSGESDIRTMPHNYDFASEYAENGDYTVSAQTVGEWMKDAARYAKSKDRYSRETARKILSELSGDVDILEKCAEAEDEE